MKSLLLIICGCGIITNAIGQLIAFPSIILLLANGIIAIAGGYVAGLRLKEDVAICGFVGASVVLGHIVSNGFLILFHTALRLHIRGEEAGTAHLLGGLIFAAIMPATILGGIGGISGYIGRRFSR